MSDASTNVATRPVRVLHFVTGGFSGGATQVAISLVKAACAGQRIAPLLVLRRKRHTDDARVERLRRENVPLRVTPGWSHAATVWSLVEICREFRPDILVAHGFSEHLWGRYAGLLAGVPHLVHVEHNSRERYTWWRLAQSRWLAQRTDRIVGCSEGVRRCLLAQGMPSDRTIAISNGIQLHPFDAAERHPYVDRVAGIVMVARLSKQKDHATLIKAVALLRERGLTPPVLFAGGGKALHRRPLEKLSAQLGLTKQVQFLGVCSNVPELLMTHQLAVLSTHYEGMPLALIEGMAAGCAVVGSAVPGVQEVIEDRVDGRLTPEADPLALADALESLLRNPSDAAKLAHAARRKAVAQFSRELMHRRYEELFLTLTNGERDRA